SMSLRLVVLLLFFSLLVNSSDVWGALGDSNNPSHSAVTIIFAFGLAVIVLIISIVLLTLCCCDRPPKRQTYVPVMAPTGLRNEELVVQTKEE
ncbi:hypothetical protein PFISCL1PPCAC_20571, partial [Pristionchus fissidentatus]